MAKKRGRSHAHVAECITAKKKELGQKVHYKRGHKNTNWRFTTGKLLLEYKHRQHQIGKAIFTNGGVTIHTEVKKSMTKKSSQKWCVTQDTIQQKQGREQKNGKMRQNGREIRPEGKNNIRRKTRKAEGIGAGKRIKENTEQQKQKLRADRGNNQRTEKGEPKNNK